MDDVTTPGDDGRLNLHDESGMTRRDLMKRGAVVGGTLLWVAPAIQTYGSKAFAQTNGSASCDACIAVTTGGNTRHVVFEPTEVCCGCIDVAGGQSRGGGLVRGKRGLRRHRPGRPARPLPRVGAEIHGGEHRSGEAQRVA